MNDTQKLQAYFFDYINCDDSKKDKVISDCFKSLPNQENLIVRLKNIVDSLNNKDSLYAFINNTFDIKNDVIRMDLIDNIESQLNNRTVAINKVEAKNLKIVSFNSYKIEKSISEYAIVKNKISIDGIDMHIDSISNEDNRFYNYIVEKLFDLNNDKLMIAQNDENKYIISNNILPEISNSKLVKEDALCRTNEIEYLFDRAIGDNDKKTYIRRIFLDLITNQNYRILSNGLGVINSDDKENDYYVLDGVTLKKEVAIDSLFINYYNEIEDIVHTIITNYDEILNLIEDIIKTRKDIDMSYLLNLKSNIIQVYEKGRIKQSLEDIKSIYTKEEKDELAEKLKGNIENFKQSLDIKTLKKAKSGYSSIFILLSGIIAFGILFAYLMIRR